MIIKTTVEPESYDPTLEEQYMIIDLHAHALNERFIVDLAKSPVAGFGPSVTVKVSMSSGVPATIGRARWIRISSIWNIGLKASDVVMSDFNSLGRHRLCWRGPAAPPALNWFGR